MVTIHALTPDLFRSHVARNVRLGFAIAVTLVFIFASNAHAQNVLPLIVDGSGDVDEVWWVDETPPGDTPFHVALTAVDDGIFVSPASMSERAQAVSSVYRQPRLNVSNAANLGRLLGVDYVLHGVLRSQAARVDEVEEFVAVTILDAELIDTRTQATVSDVRITMEARETTGLDARRKAASYLADALRARTAELLGAESTSVANEAEMELTVTGTGSALPFVSFRRSVRQKIGERGALMECAATEGAVTLCIKLDSAAERDRLASEISALEGQFVDNQVRVASIEPGDNGFTVVLQSDERPDAPALPFE